MRNFIYCLLLLLTTCLYGHNSWAYYYYYPVFGPFFYEYDFADEVDYNAYYYALPPSQIPSDNDADYPTISESNSNHILEADNTINKEIYPLYFEE